MTQRARRAGLKRFRFALLLAVAAAVTGSCQPKVGSEAWCKAMRDKPRGDWTVNEATDFAKSCILR